MTRPLAELRGRHPSGQTCASCTHRTCHPVSKVPACGVDADGVTAVRPEPLASSGDPACVHFASWGDTPRVFTRATIATAHCRRCGDVRPELEWQVNADGTMHLRALCPGAGCGWLKFMPQTPEVLAEAPERATVEPVRQGELW